LRNVHFFHSALFEEDFVNRGIFTKDFSN